MSHPRQVIPGATWAVVRRCSEQRFFLKPSAWVNRVLAFLLAHYAAKHGIALHGFVFMANHFHLVLTDVEGRLPFFMGELDSMLSRVLNARLRRRGSLWERQPYTAFRLHSAEETLGQLAYIAANPVEAQVVRTPGAWPGLVSLPGEVGTSRRCLPPRGGLFGCGHETSALPASSILQLTVPPVFAPLDPAAFRTRFARTLRSWVREIASRVERFAGPGSVRSLDPFTSPRGPQAPSFSLRPTLTNATPEQRAELKAWRAAYRQAFYAWQRSKTTVFPSGTWQMRVRHRALVQPNPG